MFAQKQGPCSVFFFFSKKTTVHDFFCLCSFLQRAHNIKLATGGKMSLPLCSGFPLSFRVLFVASHCSVVVLKLRLDERKIAEATSYSDP